MNNVGVAVTSTDLPKAIEFSTRVWVSGRVEQAAMSGALHSRLVGQVRQLLIGILSGNIRLRGIDAGNELPERFVGCFSHTICVGRTLQRPIVHGQRKILEDEMNIRIFAQQLFNRRAQPLCNAGIADH